MKILKAIHQGDVLFLKLAKPMEVSKLKLIKNTKNMGLIIQHGEALAHYHRVKQPSTLKAYELDEVDSVRTMVLVVNKDTEVIHEEHAPVILTPGFWIGRTQRETFKGLTRPVID